MKGGNLIYHKEVKRQVRSYRLAGVLAAFHAVLLAVGFFSYYILVFRVNEELGAVNVTGNVYAGILPVYRILAAMEFLMTLLVTPMFAADMVCGEREKQTLPLLLTLPVSSFGIVCGKLAAAVHMTGLVLLSSLPIFGLVFSIGGIRPVDLALLFLELLLNIVLFASISICFSTFCKKTSAAYLFTYLMLFLLMGINMLTGNVSVGNNAPAGYILSGNALLRYILEENFLAEYFLKSSSRTGYTALWESLFRELPLIMLCNVLSIYKVSKMRN